MPKCLHCNNNGIYDNSTLCRAHRNFVFSPAVNITYKCNKCLSDDVLKCIDCEKEMHLCNKCDTCNCGVREKEYMYYDECRCFSLCSNCINERKSWE